jgi:hypothetical protein
LAINSASDHNILKLFQRLPVPTLLASTTHEENCHFMTARGTKVYEALFPIVEGLNREMLSGLSEAEREQLSRIIRKLEDAATRLPDALPNLPKANRRRMPPADRGG